MIQKEKSIYNLNENLDILSQVKVKDEISKMKKSYFLILSLVLGFSVRMPDSALAHGGHFHSLNELAEHIKNHMTELESALSQKPLDPALVNHERLEIIEHGRQYQRAIQRLAAKGRRPELAKILDPMAAALVRAGHSGDLIQGLNILRQIQTLLAQSLSQGR